MASRAATVALAAALQAASKVSNHAVDDRRGHHGLADGCICGPTGAVLVEVIDRNCQEVVRIHEASVSSDDAVAIRIRVVSG